MSKKNKKNEPYKPLPYREGNTIIRIYEEPFEDSMGNKAILKLCDYKDKKKKLHERHTLQVKWLPDENELVGKEKKSFINSFWNVDEDLHFLYYDGYLNYFFKHNKKLYLAYFWDGKVGYNHRFMVFELNDSVVPTPIEEQTLFGEDLFEGIMEKMVSKNMIKEFFSVDITRYNIKVLKGKRAKFVFDLLYNKYCKKD